MITLEHSQELLHRAYILAVASYARVNLKGSGELDYGSDGTLDDVSEHIDAHGNKVLIESGLPLRFQAKATTSYGSNASHIKYSCKASAYNRIVMQNQMGSAPMILLVFCMPKAKTQWLSITEAELIIRKACYWYYLTGQQTAQSSKVIAIPRSQLFTAEALRDIMNRMSNGGTP